MGDQLSRLPIRFAISRGKRVDDLPGEGKSRSQGNCVSSDILLYMSEAHGPIHPAAQLDYAPAPSARWKIIRRTLIAFCVLAISLAGWYWGPGAWRRTQILYWQWRCMNYVPATDEVAYDGVIVARPECWERLSALTGITLPVGLRGWIPGPGSEPLVFVGELEDRLGLRRLVVVQGNRTIVRFPSAQGVPNFGFGAVAIGPGGLGSDPQRLGGIVSHGLGTPIRPGAFKIYMGQRDPEDPSHFTIRYTVDGTDYIADGRIGENQSVQLRFHPADATPAK